MGIRHDVEQGLKKYEITKIDGQPMDEDLNLLTKEATNAAGCVATQNGGEEHGHVGMVINEAEYVTFSRSGARFVIPTNQGPYPASVDMKYTQPLQLIMQFLFAIYFANIQDSQHNI